MRPVRAACVRYLNTAPLVEGLDKSADISLIPAAPAAIGAMLARGEADIGLASLVDALRLPHAPAVLPCGMIGCDGPTLTVRLFSTRPASRINTLHADTESHTSVVLARLVLAEAFGRDVAVLPLDTGAESPGAGAEEPEAVLLIGDKAVTRAPDPRRYPHELDLGQAWHDLTGLPFVYAVWMCRAADATDPSILAAADLLERQRLRNALRLEAIVARRAPEHGWAVETARRYLGDLLRYDLTPRARAAASEFLMRAWRRGLIEGAVRAPADIAWVEPARAVGAA